MEERSVLRRPISETTNSLSVSDRVRPSLDFFWRWPSGSRDTRVRERVSADKLGKMCLGHLASQPTLGSLGQPEKAIGHESPIEPWLAPDHPFCFAGFRTDWLRREQPMKTAGRKNPNSRNGLCTEPSPWGGRPEISLLIHTGWKVRKYLAAGEVFFLTLPFIELIRWDEKAGLQRDAIRSQRLTRSRRNGSRSRNHDCSQPPPRIRTSGATASGSCLR
jgi:hypothetical protein